MQLLRFKEWVTLEEAAQYLGAVLTEEVTEADVLRLCLDGHLTLSVRLVNPAPGLYVWLYPYSEEPASSPKDRVADADGYGRLRREPPVEGYEAAVMELTETGMHVREWRRTRRFRVASGIWDIPPFGRAWLEAQNTHQDLTDSPHVDEWASLLTAPYNSFWGPILKAPGGGYYITLFPERSEEGVLFSPQAPAPKSPWPAKALPEDSQWVIRTDALQQFERQVAREQTTNLPSAEEEHVSEGLALMIKAARQFWSTAERDDPKTHPNNQEVEGWLQDQGMTKGRAKAAARIIRPGWAHMGRKPEQ